MSNHPQLAGGSHLPDITVITPVFADGQPAFFVASRGHHADVGGIAPGSMPSFSRCLAEEGAAIIAHKLVRRGTFDEEGITKILTYKPENVPSAVGTRNLEENLSDLRAQASYTKLLKADRCYSKATFQFYSPSYSKATFHFYSPSCSLLCLRGPIHRKSYLGSVS